MVKGEHRIAIEIKSTSSPSVPKGFHNRIQDLQVNEAYLIAKVDESWETKGSITVTHLVEFLNKMKLTHPE